MPVAPRNLLTTAARATAGASSVARRCLGSAAAPPAAEPPAAEVAEATAQSPPSSPEASQGRRLLHPPGAGATAEKAKGFATRVVAAFNVNAEVELRPVGGLAMWHALRALTVGPTAADFEVSWLDGPEAGEREVRRAVRIIARKGSAWENFDTDISSGFFVSNSTQVLPLARKLDIELRSSERVTVHTYTDAEVAMGVILKALASVPLLGTSLPLLCTSGSNRREGDPAPRLLVQARRVGAGAAESRPDDFVAYPLGAKADPAGIKQFEDSVRGRLGQGRSVVMECRGKDAVANALVALASVQGRTAEVEASWVAGYVPGHEGGFSAARALQLRATSGETWQAFNATDFSRTGLRRVAGSTEVKQMARTIGSEVKRLGGVALHAPAADRAAVFVAVKSLASVPVEHSLRVHFVPSFGWAKGTAGGASGGDAGRDDDEAGRARVLRLYARRRRGAGRGTPGAENRQRRLRRAIRPLP